MRYGWTIIVGRYFRADASVVATITPKTNKSCNVYYYIDFSVYLFIFFFHVRSWLVDDNQLSFKRSLSHRKRPSLRVINSTGFFTPTRIRFWVEKICVMPFRIKKKKKKSTCVFLKQNNSATASDELTSTFEPWISSSLIRGRLAHFRKTLICHIQSPYWLSWQYICIYRYII